TAAPRSVDRGDEATGRAVENEPTVLPRRALTEPSQSLRIAPDGTWVRLVRFCQCLRLRGLLLRHIQPLPRPVQNRVTCWTKFLRGSPQNQGVIVSGVGVECCTDAIERIRPCLLNRRPHVSAPEAGHVLKSQNQMV